MGSAINGLFQLLLLHITMKMKINRIFHSCDAKFVQADDSSGLFGKKDKPRNQQIIAEFFYHCWGKESINRVDLN